MGGVGNVRPCMDDIPDYQVQEKLRKVYIYVALMLVFSSYECKSLYMHVVKQPSYRLYLCVQLQGISDQEEFRIHLSSAEFSFRFDCGVCQSANGFTLKDKSDIISSIAMHYCIYSSKGELDEVKRGLKSLGFLDVVSKNPILRSLFEHSHSKVTAELVEETFVPEFSPIGSNMRAKEEAVMMWFSELLHEIEGM